MKSNILKLGFILAGTAGILLLSPKRVQSLKNCSLIRDILSKQKLNIEPSKINFC